MKDLSIEEKARRYDEAIEKFDVILNLDIVKESGTIFADDVRKILPELAESEDEKIRKALIKLVKKAGEGYENVIDSVSIENAISWLEKQGEPKEHDVCDNCEQQGSCVSPCPMKLVEKQGEQKHDWSEEDNKMLRFIGNAITADDASIYLKSKGIQIIDAHIWLEDLKRRVLPQPKQEWSEEDEDIIEESIFNWLHENNCDAFDKYGNVYVSMDNLKELVKSLRPRSQWKPSDEQIEALESATENCAYSEYQDCLRELIEQLKKLKG